MRSLSNRGRGRTKQTNLKINVKLHSGTFLPEEMEIKTPRRI
jgi:hypothetical protein